MSKHEVIGEDELANMTPAQLDAFIRVHRTPDDRRTQRISEQESAIDYATRLGTPKGLRGLFPSNRVRMTMRRINPKRK